VLYVQPLPRWVLLTGGEPGLHPLRSLVEALHARRLLVACETSGTARGVLRAGIDWLTVSPKLGMPGGQTLEMEVLAYASELKFVVGKAADLHNILTLLDVCQRTRDLLGIDVATPEAVVCVQPMSQSASATALCVEWALKYGWRVSIQVHKVMGAR